MTRSIFLPSKPFALLQISFLSCVLKFAGANNIIPSGEVFAYSDWFQRNTVTPFPHWLSEITGLREWPGLNPPYIPLDFINQKAIPSIPKHRPGECSMDHSSCSFDCHHCVSFDDVYTCPKLSQTFDDGPSSATPKLLEQLNTKTTFFTLGINVVRYPEVYRTSTSRGHVMGSHTWSHKFLPELSNEDIIAQIEWSIWAMNATAGHLPKWFRPPYGGTDERVRTIVRMFGMQCVLWDFDTFDWKLTDLNYKRKETQIYNDVISFKQRNSRRGLMLEHDGTSKNVDVAIGINNIVGPDQLTVPQCIGGIDYIRSYSSYNHSLQ